MSIVAWIVIGLISGFIASKLANDGGDGLRRSFMLGVAGALFGGWVCATMFNMGSFTELNLWGLIVAALGAGSALLFYQMVWRRD